MDRENVEQNKLPEALKSKERKEIYQKMERMLGHIAVHINDEVGLKDRKGNKLPLVDDGNHIEMRSFYTKVGGPHKKAEAGEESDLRLVDRLEGEFAHVEDFDNLDVRLNEWKESRDLGDPSLAESAMTILLHKALGEKYIVVKSSSYDDYVNGVDNVVLSKETGKVVCAFDELVNLDTAQEGADNDRYYKKIERSKKNLARDGGMDVKYGISRDMNSGEYIRTATDNVPAFCLAIDTPSLHKLVRDMSEKFDNKTDIEVQMVNNIIKSLQEQKNILLHNQTEEFDEHIQSMDAIIEQLNAHTG